MRAIITGGGTGGHIYPALAIADSIKKHEPDSEILYVGNYIGYEKDIVPKHGYKIELVDAKWFDRKNIFKLFETVKMNLKGIRQSKKIIKKFKPDVIIGTGGYVCFPVIYAGHKLKIKCFLHEQNAYPGMANKSLEPFVSKIFLGFEEASSYFKNPDKHITVGNPVREEFFYAKKDESRKKLNISGDAFVIFAFGGSQGAETFARELYPLIEKYKDSSKVYFIFATGGYYYKDILFKATSSNGNLNDNIRIESYIDDMPSYIAASDVIIGRAGALSVAEICTVGRASILVPSPNVTGNHQYFNAKSVSDKNGAILIEEKDFNFKKVYEELKVLQDNPGLIRSMEKEAHKCAPKDPANVIYQFIRNYISKDKLK